MGMDKHGLEHAATQTISAIGASNDTRMRFCLWSAARYAGCLATRRRPRYRCAGNLSAAAAIKRRSHHASKASAGFASFQRRRARNICRHATGTQRKLLLCRHDLCRGKNIL